MARKVEEELVGYGFAVKQVDIPVTDEQGNPIFNGGEGGPKMQPGCMIDLVCQTPFELHIVHLSLTKQAKDELVRQLTGGVLVAGAGEIPKI